MKFKAVLFDLGGTLIEYENQDWPTLGKMGIAAGYSLVKEMFPHLPRVEQFGETFYKHLREILDERNDHSEVELYDTCTRIFNLMGLSLNDGIVEKFVDMYYQPVTNQITLIPGAIEILDTIEKHGLSIGLVSNSIFPEKFHRGEMERFGLLRHFDFTIFSSTVGIRKPSKKIFNMALKKADVKSSQAIFIGVLF